jgi:hypothetical protein
VFLQLITSGEASGISGDEKQSMMEGRVYHLLADVAVRLGRELVLLSEC